jgi:hypothetical protein
MHPSGVKTWRHRNLQNACKYINLQKEIFTGGTLVLAWIGAHRYAFYQTLLFWRYDAVQQPVVNAAILRLKAHFNATSIRLPFDTFAVFTRRAGDRALPPKLMPYRIDTPRRPAAPCP